MIIGIVGYMGSGKSTVGPLLAKQLHYEFIDFDHYIETQEKTTITEIFEAKGEIYFRKIEAAYLVQLLEEVTKDTVIAFGGGTPCYGDNMKTIKDAGVTTVYLNVHFKELTRRLWESREGRPLIAAQPSSKALKDYVRKHLFERGFYYNLSDHAILTKEASPEEIVENIKAKLF